MRGPNPDERMMLLFAGAFIVSLVITIIGGLVAGTFFACFAGFYIGLQIRAGKLPRKA
jgi:uncharacterized integral membrane protein